MLLLCFVLDLRSLSPPVLRDLKQSLLQLANYYAVSCRKINNSSDSTHSTAKPLLDCIGLCYVWRNRTSCSDELKIAYTPQGNFNLRDFHHALNSLATDAFLPEYNDSVCIYKADLKLADVLSEKTIYAWGDHDKNVARKVIFISSFLVGTLDSVTMKALMDADDKRVSMEFILLDQTSSYLGDFTENVNHFVKQIGSLKNCSFQTCVPNLQVLHGFAKRWFQELKDDREEPLQAHFIFKTNLISTLNQISCNLCSSFNPIVDEFTFCQRLSASEEFLPIPDVSQFISSVAVEEIENTVQDSLLKLCDCIEVKGRKFFSLIIAQAELEVSDYNPVQHERGLHQKLNLLVKESLQFGAILPKSKEGISSSNSNLRSPEAQPPMEAAGTVVVPVDEPPPCDPKPVEKKGGPCLTEEWEQLVVIELKGIHSPTCISNLKLDQVVTSPSQSNRQVDEKTSRILERLELPRQLKRKAVSPTMSITLSAPAKKPLIPYKPTDTADQGPVLSQPIKPNFQRIKKGRDTKANHMR
ncbi:UNVERIFIED_CONTAM: hypothetical protein Sangu_0095600 [Sesamum angustifolium]|uniref:Uncharacterized protein n=1 Tax=Sesamum angustifolium TaxID=2727405 RepID=A0AAW2RLI4_9LAMI